MTPVRVRVVSFMIRRSVLREAAPLFSSRSHLPRLDSAEVARPSGGCDGSANEAERLALVRSQEPFVKVKSVRAMTVVPGESGTDAIDEVADPAGEIDGLLVRGLRSGNTAASHCSC
jgi:hypothetical protein